MTDLAVANLLANLNPATLCPKCGVDLGPNYYLCYNCPHCGADLDATDLDDDLVGENLIDPEPAP